MENKQQTLILIQCQDAVGLVAHIANTLADYQLNIVTMREFVDEEANKFFIRIACHGHTADPLALSASLRAVLPPNTQISVNPNHRKKIIILATKEHHCLADILVRHYFQSWDVEVQAVIANYDVLKDFSEKFAIPFHFISHEGKSKADFEEEIMDQIHTYAYDYIILAKFMRILSANFVKEYEHKLINIHHSFLPAFIGANPYRQAHTRGVKIIGATAHFVTNDLDEGPIIVQNTTRVTHNYNTADMVSAGKEIEKSVLSKAIKLLSEDRVMLNGNKTVVFES